MSARRVPPAASGEGSRCPLLQSLGVGEVGANDHCVGDSREKGRCPDAHEHQTQPTCSGGSSGQQVDAECRCHPAQHGEQSCGPDSRSEECDVDGRPGRRSGGESDDIGRTERISGQRLEQRPCSGERSADCASGEESRKPSLLNAAHQLFGSVTPYRLHRPDGSFLRSAQIEPEHSQANDGSK